MNIKRIIIFALIVGILGLGLIQIFNLGSFGGPDLSKGNATILVLAVDSSEQRPGMGGVDMVFIVNLTDGDVTSMEPVYPGNMYDPDKAPPAGVNTKRLMLHDSLWEADGQAGMQEAKKIVELHTGQKTDGVVAVSIQSVDKMIKSVGPLEAGGMTFTGEDGQTIELLRESQNQGASRGVAVENLAKALIEASKDKQKLITMAKIAMEEKGAGNIQSYPEGLFNNLIATKGLSKII